MESKTKQWSAGGGSATIQYDGHGDGNIIMTSDANSLYEARSMQITVKTTDGSGIQRVVTINQAAKQRIDISAAVVTATTQTYSGSALTPAPTVTLNGETIPSTGYDVTYSDNTNAGTATITVTGKGEYAGTTTGTFTINKATPSYTAPAARTNLTYTGDNQYLTTTGSTSDGTIKYSLDGVNWYTTRRQGSTAGTYTSYWKLEGDSNHTDISSTSISTTIAKASRTLSFADTYMVLNTSSTGTKTATPSAGSGDGAITYSIANTTYATINSSTGAVTSKTSDGSVIVAATIAEGTNYKSASASYTLYVFATTHNYSYSGSAKNVTLPPGTYQFQCWGAQGASCSDGYSGGKGGYSVGQLSIANALAIQVLVGGQNGYNGGGSSSGSASYSSGDTYGRSSMGNGGGASDIRLSDGALLSRMIVAGGGSGGAYCYKETTTTTTTWETLATIDCSKLTFNRDGSVYLNWGVSAGGYTWLVTTRLVEAYENHAIPYSPDNWLGLNAGDVVKIETSSNVKQIVVGNRTGSVSAGNYTSANNTSSCTWTVVKANDGFYVLIRTDSWYYTGTITIKKQVTTSSTSTSNDSQVGFVGGGATGAGYSSTYQGKQNAAGSGGLFGQGANQAATNYRYCSGAGGGGWYGGGGGQKSDSSMTYVHYSGGGSGFVNTAANAGNRPSGYTGLELDSGTTYAGNTSFPATGGGNETGHSGDGYVRITRIS